MLLDHPRLLSQFANLQRKTGAHGRDSIDHPKGQRAYDDVCNAATISLVMAQQLRAGGSSDRGRREMPKVTVGYEPLKWARDYARRSVQPSGRNQGGGKDPWRKVIFNSDGSSREEFED